MWHSASEIKAERAIECLEKKKNALNFPNINCGVWSPGSGSSTLICCDSVVFVKIPVSASAPASLTVVQCDTKWPEGNLQMHLGWKERGKKQNGPGVKAISPISILNRSELPPIPSIYSVFRCRRTQLPSNVRDRIEADRKLNMSSKHAVSNFFPSGKTKQNKTTKQALAKAFHQRKRNSSLQQTPLVISVRGSENYVFFQLLRRGLTSAPWVKVGSARKKDPISLSHLAN